MSDPSTKTLKARIVNTDDVMSMFGSIERLKDRDFARQWHAFPTTADELQATFAEIGLSGENPRFEVNAYDTGMADLDKILPRSPDLNELNYLAVKIGQLSDDDRATFEAAIEAGLHCDSMHSLINLADNIGRFDLQPAFNAEQYGNFHIEKAKDETTAIFDRFENSPDPDERAFAQYILRLEATVDEKAFGQSIINEENGHFTKHGYLTEQEGFQNKHISVHDIPAEHRVMAAPELFRKVENADLTSLLAKIHATSGEYTSDMSYNLNTLESKRSAEYIMVMNGRNIFLTEASHAYRRATTAFDTILNAAETPDTRAFALHVTNVHDVHVMGDLVEVNLRELQLDVLHHSIHPTHIDATPKFGEDVSFTPEEWAKLEPIDRDRLESWTRKFDSADHQAVRRHLDDVTDHHEKNSKPIGETEFLSDLNETYMRRAQNHAPDMLRIDLAAAKEMLSHGDAPVYRLLPEGAKELTSLGALPSRGSLWFQEHREFAVKKADIAGLDKWANRAADEAVKQIKQRNQPEKPKQKSRSYSRYPHRI